MIQKPCYAAKIPGEKLNKGSMDISLQRIMYGEIAAIKNLEKGTNYVVVLNELWQ